MQTKVHERNSGFHARKPSGYPPLETPVQGEKRQHRKEETGTGPQKEELKRSITKFGRRFRAIHYFDIFCLFRIVHADSARFGRCLRHVPVYPSIAQATFVPSQLVPISPSATCSLRGSASLASSFCILFTHAIRKQKWNRIPWSKDVKYLLGVRMVLSGMGTELLQKLLRADAHSLPTA